MQPSPVRGAHTTTTRPGRFAPHPPCKGRAQKTYMTASIDGLDLLVNVLHQLLVLLVRQVCKRARVNPRAPCAVERDLNSELVLQVPQLEAHFVILPVIAVRQGLPPRFHRFRAASGDSLSVRDHAVAGAMHLC